MVNQQADRTHSIVNHYLVILQIEFVSKSNAYMRKKSVVCNFRCSAEIITRDLSFIKAISYILRFIFSIGSTQIHGH